ncbi:MAG TPA: carboxymuconolactone decarboxylase family protein [Mycobacteriales bacterium]|jgi:4-carboxymuconolactone decarboxylase|nr:carboxymuconolactone decarboxylase family protein [Mycobacteriales bacterium]
MTDATAEAGRERRIRAQGRKHRELEAVAESLDPRLAQWIDGWIFGEVWDEEMSFGDRQLVAIVALAATDKPSQLKNYLHGALQDGMPPRRIHEALLMLSVYVGFPTTLQALGVWREVVVAARRNGAEIDVPLQ